MEQFVRVCLSVGLRVPTGGDWTWTPVDSDSGSGVFAGVPIVASGLVSPTPSLRWWPHPPNRVPQS